MRTQITLHSLLTTSALVTQTQQIIVDVHALEFSLYV